MDDFGILLLFYELLLDVGNNSLIFIWIDFSAEKLTTVTGCVIPPAALMGEMVYRNFIMYAQRIIS